MGPPDVNIDNDMFLFYCTQDTNVLDLAVDGASLTERQKCHNFICPIDRERTMNCGFHDGSEFVKLPSVLASFGRTSLSP